MTVVSGFGPFGLRPREMETLELVVQGLSRGEIALVLGIEKSTVRWYMKQITRRTGARGLIQAAVLVERQRARLLARRAYLLGRQEGREEALARWAAPLDGAN